MWMEFDLTDICNFDESKKSIFVTKLIKSVNDREITELSRHEIRLLAKATVELRHYLMPTEMPRFSGDLHRARVSPLEDVEAYSGITYLPADKCTSFGRCHSPGLPAFYASQDLITIISEVRPREGDTICIGKSKPNHGQFLKCYVIGQLDHYRRFKQRLVGPPGLDKDLDAIVSDPSNRNNFLAMLLDAFISSEFKRPAPSQADYYFTSAICEEIFAINVGDEKEYIDAILYPSVAYDSGLNLCIRPSAFDTKYSWQNLFSLDVIEAPGFGLYKVGNQKMKR